jgi:hypothetical protein
MAVEEVAIAFGFGATAIASGDGNDGGSVVATSEELSGGRNASFSASAASAPSPRCPAVTGFARVSGGYATPNTQAI